MFLKAIHEYATHNEYQIYFNVKIVASKYVTGFAKRDLIAQIMILRYRRF